MCVSVCVILGLRVLLNKCITWYPQSLNTTKLTKISRRLKKEKSTMGCEHTCARLRLCLYFSGRFIFIFLCCVCVYACATVCVYYKISVLPPVSSVSIETKTKTNSFSPGNILMKGKHATRDHKFIMNLTLQLLLYHD